MGLIKNRHGVYNAQKRVPPSLREAVATVLGADKVSQSWLKKSLGTKNLAEANIRAKPVLAEFDRILARAEALTSERPLRTTLAAAEIKQMADYLFGFMLASDDQFRRDAPAIEREQRALDDSGEPFVHPIPAFGLSGGQMLDAKDNMPELIAEAEQALARGDISHVSHKIEDVEAVFRVRVDPNSAAYRELGIALLRAFVRGLRAISQRYQGEPIETPKLVLPNEPASGGTLKDAYEGWQKATKPSQGTLAEYSRAVDLFTQLHGNLPLTQIKRSHARTFREALQDIPRRRVGALKKAPLPELAEWSKAHPEVPRISSGTVNKLLGGVQAVTAWGAMRGGLPPVAAMTLTLR